MPSEKFPRLNLREIVSLRDIEDSDGKTGSTDEVDKVVVGEVHGCPPYPHNVGAEGDTGLREEVVEVEGVEGCPTGVEGGEGAEDDGGGGEGGGVELSAEKFVYSV
jgi:hypothetical protein